MWIRLYTVVKKWYTILKKNAHSALIKMNTVLGCESVECQIYDLKVDGTNPSGGIVVCP